MGQGFWKGQLSDQPLVAEGGSVTTNGNHKARRAKVETVAHLVRSAVCRERASRSYEAVVAEALAQRRVIGDGSNPLHSIAVFRGLP